MERTAITPLHQKNHVNSDKLFLIETMSFQIANFLPSNPIIPVTSFLSFSVSSFLPSSCFLNSPYFPSHTHFHAQYTRTRAEYRASLLKIAYTYSPLFSLPSPKSISFPEVIWRHYSRSVFLFSLC